MSDCVTGSDLVEYVSNLGWKVDGSSVSIPPNVDNQVEASVVRESISLPREYQYQAPSKFQLETNRHNRAFKNHRSGRKGELNLRRAVVMYMSANSRMLF